MELVGSLARSQQHAFFYPRSMLILSSHSHLGLSSGLFTSGIPNKILCVFLISSIRATYTFYLILLNLIALIILLTSLFSRLQPPVTSSLLGPNILLSAFSNHSQCVLLLMPDTEVHTHTKQQVKLYS